MCIANGSLSLFKRLLVAGTAFMVQQNTLWSGTNLDMLLGRAIAGGTMGDDGTM